MVILNKNNSEVTLDIKRYSQMIPERFEATEIITGKPVTVQQTLQVPAHTPMILELK